VGVLLDLLDESGPVVAGRGEAGDPALARGNDCKLGAGEKTVDQNQKQNNHKFIQDRFQGSLPP
jgi:hypothetical protein